MKMAMKSILVISLCLISTLSASARPVPKFYKDWKWWIGEGIIATSVILDADSTNHVMRNCPMCIEKSFFLTERPSPKRVWLTQLGVLGVYTAIHGLAHYESSPSATWHPNKFWHFAGYLATPVPVAIGHLSAASSNYSIAANCRAALLVCR